nr:autophagy-related protein 9A [Onthophagus taurus]XP_022914148.1 autophagy-related protein 9A [Onthophagus taurus]XP_022914150.1 autophagy-related protein 9A [Onthophagus taurus]
MNNYATLQDVETEDTGVLFHVAEQSRARWNHIQDLDSFFSRMYKYHQRHGFFCMLAQEISELIQFVFIIFFTVFLIYFIDYDMLFRNKLPPGNSTRVTIGDVVYPVGEWAGRLNMWTWIVLLIAFFVWLLRLCRSGYSLLQYWDIKQFYNTALGFADSDLENLTWHQIQTKVRAVQLEQEMCIHKRELTELDIYHRILRQVNYFVAMTNKRLIPPRIQFPLLGEVIYWTRGLRYNIQLLLFCSPWAPFENPWHLKEEYRKQNLRHELARKLSTQIKWLALGNAILIPLIFVWQLLHTFFSYAESLKREPGILGLRNWSMYGRLYLRHFNELDHEFQARLCRAHRPASRYLAVFGSSLAAIIARCFMFMCSSILAVFIILTAYDPDVISVEHLLTVMTVLGGLIPVCRAMIPDETTAYCPELLLANVLQYTDYLPPGWRGQAHTIRIRTEFQQLFQYKFVAILEELFSPLLTPYVLWTYFKPRSLDLVDFFRNFTVSVVGVGDVCSFAQMDVRRHGNPDWQETDSVAPTPRDQYTQAEDGKTELSLMHFRTTNPQWIPPPESMMFVENIERESMSIHPAQINNAGDMLLMQTNLTDSSLQGPAWKAEGPLNSLPNHMNASTMYLHQLNHSRQTGNRYIPTAVETTPLLQSPQLR